MTSPLVALAVLLATAFATGPQTDNLIAPDLEPGGTFFDDDGSTHEGYIEALAAIDVLRGCNPPLSDFTCPADPITRGQMAALLRRSLRLPPASGDAFDDDDGSTFEEDINRVATAGITRGCDAAHPRLFCPDEFVTRGQMAAFLNRGFDLPPSKVDRFSDDDRSTFEKDIDRVASAGITEGCDPDYPRRFCPLELVTRGQMASFLGRALGVDALRPAERPAFTLAVTGDILIHSPLMDRAAVYGDSSGQPYDFRPMFQRIAPIIASADLALCHLEVPLSADNQGLSGYPLFNAPREVAQAIASAGYEGCSTASNHSIDQGVRGAAETLDVLDAAGVGHTGTARNPEEAANPRLYQVGDVTVGHLSYTYWLNGLSPPSGQEWVANVIDQSAILAEAARARAEGADLVVVSLHWGVEYQSDPTSSQLSLAQALLGSGAIDLIVGHHAHVVQPIGRAGERHVVYGLGNLVSNQCCLETQDGVIVELEMARRAENWWDARHTAFVPTRVDRGGYVVLPITATLESGSYAWLRSELEASRARTAATIRRFGLGAELR
jgi:poly-gamma-glutamate synthesis protein (capsule biosynthesis protein)